ncbi:MAG: biotin--acetyl-CoA-carboxylase ligase [Bryobacterales bacterium]|jgi:BirA family transcriptional regulator, biotin operon repressor / biotin---[acetyl-CoA-carboxylase] ligase|nr:biotin--acetyl-CoA-carboxylase ligase [Bryobacterales bacterium]
MSFDIEKVQEARPQNQIHFFSSVGSTMSEAVKLAASAAPHGAVVIADEQTAGIGRLGRSWHSEAEAGIYCSILLRLALPPGEIPIATLLLGLATAEAIQQVTSLACDLRWPNDVLINERKVAGILAQLSGDFVIAGIGINVNQMELPSNLRTPATSLRVASGGTEQSREELLIHLLQAIDAFCALLKESGPAAILRSFAVASSYALHRRVIVEETGRTGVTAGLDQSGFLLVRYESGRVERIAAGGVRPDV